MRRKWVLAGLWAAIALNLALLLVGCDRQPGDAGGGTLARVRTEGVLRWGADPSGGAPFVYFDPNNPDRVIGFEVDLVERLSERLGVRPELVRSDWLALVDQLRSGRIDVAINGLEVNAERARQIDFTTPYYQYEQQLTVRAEDADKYQTLAELKGRPVAVLNGSASVDVLREAGWTDALILQYDDSLTPYEEVKLGRADAALAESIIAAYYAGKDLALVSQSRTFSPGLYAAALRQGDDDLRMELNRLLDEMKQSGELGNLYARWGIWTPAQAALGIAPPTEDASSAPIENGEGVRPVSIWPALLRASLYTLLLTALSMPLALAAGLLLALTGRSRRIYLRWPTVTYIQVMRGTPLLVQIYLIYYSLPQLGLGLEDLFGSVGTAVGLGSWFVWPKFAVGVFCLAANYAAYEAEIHRAGIEAIPRGQREAALALGLSERQTFTHIVLPQSFRIILPPVLNDLIAMLKDSCLVSVIGVQELLSVALGIGKARFTVPEMLLAAALLYLLMSLAADVLGKRLEAWLRRRGEPELRTKAGHR